MTDTSPIFIDPALLAAEVPGYLPERPMFGNTRPADERLLADMKAAWHRPAYDETTFAGRAQSLKRLDLLRAEARANPVGLS
jgi:hypothetical protein